MSSLGPSAANFQSSWCASTVAEACNAAQAISQMESVTRTPIPGGILEWRYAYPDDPHLRYWSSLVLEASGLHALALAEYAQAQAKGLPGIHPVPGVVAP